MGHYASEMDPDFGKPEPLDPLVLSCKKIQNEMNNYARVSADVNAVQLATAIRDLAAIVERLAI